MKILFVHDWEPNYEQEFTWQDGLAGALLELKNRGHEVDLFTFGEEYGIIHNPYFLINVFPKNQDFTEGIRREKYDVILHWADQTRPHAKSLAELGKPMAICFAGGNPLGENIEFFDHIFVESKVYKDTLNSAGYDNVSIAFGTNTDLFQPIKQVKLFDTILPATFALWKRHNLYAKATNGLKSLACGYMYENHEQECWQVCLNNGVTILPHVSAQVLKYLYAASRVCVVPSRSDGGSQRTVLEAMAMNIPLVVCDSDKFDYIEGQQVGRVEPEVEPLKNMIYSALTAEVNTRDYVLKNWSHITYADALEKGLESIL